MLSNINISLFGNDARIEDEKMDDHDLSPEAEVEEDPETDQLSKEKEDCFYCLNWELIEWMTEPCHPCMAPRSDNG